MNVEIVTPDDYMGDVNGDLNRRRGVLQGVEESVVGRTIRAQVPLAEMFGYATDLRSTTQGKAEFTMEFAKYLPAPSEVQKELKEKYKSKIVDEDE